MSTNDHKNLFHSGKVTPSEDEYGMANKDVEKMNDGM